MLICVSISGGPGAGIDGGDGEGGDIDAGVEFGGQAKVGPQAQHGDRGQGHPDQNRSRDRKSSEPHKSRRKSEKGDARSLADAQEVEAGRTSWKVTRKVRPSGSATREIALSKRGQRLIGAGVQHDTSVLADMQAR